LNKSDSEKEIPCKNEAEVSEAADLPEEIEKILTEEREKAERYFHNWQRAEADFTNYKKHVERERQDLIAFANTSLLLTLLPIIDDLERAFSALPPELNDHPWIDGIKSIMSKTESLLKAQGLEAIEARGEPFDPTLHEAILCCDGEEGKVAEELQKGYLLKGKLLRPCMVKVGKKQEENQQK